MSEKNRKFLLRTTALVAFVLILGLVIALAFVAGRRSMADEVSNSSVQSTLPVVSSERKPATSEPNSEADLGEEESEDVAPHFTTTPGRAVLPELIPATVESILQPGPRKPVELTSEDLEVLFEVWELIDREFDGPLPEKQEVLYAAIDGSLQLLNDEFTRFLTPDVAASAQERLEGSFEGIGAFVDITEDGFLLIVRPIEDQPADLAGIRGGDIVTHVDGQNIQNLALEQIVALVKGPEGTEVTLTIIREGRSEPFEINIIRDIIEIPIVESDMLEDDIAYLRLTRFSSNATEQVEAALQELLADNPEGLILDLRDNPGGFLPETVEIADLFLSKGIILYQSDSQGEEKIFESSDGDIAETIPLVVLINQGSASASEIVAGAVKDRGRGLLIGQTTFGKGSVQQSNTLSDGSVLRVTISRWYSPDRITIDQLGVEPDISVENPEEFRGENDTQLQAAIEALLSLN